MRSLCDDLEAEHADLDSLVAPLPDPDWERPTPAPGWSVRDQISHIAFFDRAAVLAATDEAAFRDATEELLAAEGDPSVEFGRSVSPSGLLDLWRSGRSEMVSLFRTLDPAQRLPWYGPAMSAASFATARLMETWSHGCDVADALGAAPPATERLRHVAHIGVRARPFSYATNGREVPDGEIYVELVPPGGGEPWTWGHPAAPDRVDGPALDFCLVVTQRRHPDDTELVVEGPLASDWIAIAQAFAGPPGEGRRPGQFA
jgi:uncharacterized protein (TIGR03084 family)